MKDEAQMASDCGEKERVVFLWLPKYALMRIIINYYNT